VRWKDYGHGLEANLRDLHERVHRGSYRARPSRRVFIPKADGRLRPLGVAALEDKILQRALVEVLNAIYEVDLLGFSYGFRPGRSPHDALDALAAAIKTRRVNWMLDADIRDSGMCWFTVMTSTLRFMEISRLGHSLRGVASPRTCPSEPATVRWGEAVPSSIAPA